MTDYGRGSGSEPWHPDDPLFGDAYDRGQGYQQQPPQQQGGEWQDPYASGQHQQQYPQHNTGQYPQQEQQYQQQYPQQPQQNTGQYPHQQQYPQQGGYQGYDTGSHQTYDTGSHQTGGYGNQDPYGGQQQDPYGGQQQPGYYGQGGYQQQPQQQQPQQQQQYRQQPQQPGPGLQQPQGVQPGQQQQPGQPAPGQPARPQQPGPGARPQEPGARPMRTAPANTGEWGTDDEADPREHAFFAGRDDDDDDDVPTGSSDAGGGRRAGKSQPKGGKKRRSGCACLTVLLVLGGGLSGAVYYGYGVYQDHFGPAPDYSGNGTPSVLVEIPKGSTLTTMGNLLKKAGVVKSVDAFTAAARKNPKGQTIQAGVYALNRNMSAAAAVTMMLDPKSQNAMIVSEGMRDKQIYALIDQRLKLKPGTTEGVARAKVKSLGLPDWADTSKNVKDPLEGFLFPSRYSVAAGMKPEDLLKQMVGQAKEEFAQFDLAGEAKKEGLSSPYQLLTVASLVQAEGKTDDDFRKMAKVIYDRLLPSNKQQTNFLLQFDSTYNYIKNTSQTKIATKDVQSLKDTYNTYRNKGLTPGPIGNPGVNALKAAMNPDPGPWYFFISLDGKTTQFTETLAEFNKIKTQ